MSRLSPARPSSPLSDALSTLSPAEISVAQLVCKGYANKEIARALGKNEGTVKNQLSTVLNKLGVPSRTRLIVLLCSAEFPVSPPAIGRNGIPEWR